MATAVIILEMSKRAFAWYMFFYFFVSKKTCKLSWHTNKLMTLSKLSSPYVRGKLFSNQWLVLASEEIGTLFFQNVFS